MPSKGRLTTVPTIDPMIARRASALPGGREWIYEARLQGCRALIYKDGASVDIRERGVPGLDVRYPGVAKAASMIRAERAVIDGVVVADPDRNSELAQFYAMDVMRMNDRDLRAMPLSERREHLKNLIANSGLRPIQVLEGSLLDATRTAQQIGLSGVVAKRIDSAYHSGTSHEEWLELRFRFDGAFVIGGYLPAGGESVDALIVGMLDDCQLRYSAEVHDGVVGRVRRLLRESLDQLRTERCPFFDFPDSAASEGIVWVRPEQTARIAFTARLGEWRVAGPRLLNFPFDVGN